MLKSMNKVIAIASSKGGVGKTTIAINLAAALVGFGRVSIVVDGDLQSPNVGMHLGAPSLPVTLHDVLRGDQPIEKSIYMHPSGVRVIPASISFKDSQHEFPQDVMMVVDAARSHADMVLVDCPPGLGNESRSAIASSDSILAVTTPDLVAVTDALKTIHLARFLHKDVLGVVVNNMLPGSEVSLKDIASLLEVPVLTALPHTPAVPESLRIRHPVVFSHPDSLVSVRFKELAALMVGDTYISGLHKNKEL